MYLAPMTHDYFFAKVFHKNEVMEGFLSDLLGETVKIIEQLPRKNKLTNEAYYIKFDYRCKIKEQEVVVEMQRGRKLDVVKRFHLYHGVSAALQLERLPVTSTKSGKKVRNYSGVVPVLTIVWMAEDTFRTKESLLNYRLFPDALASFIKNEELWEKGDLQELNNKRILLKRMLDYKGRNLDFLPKNQLIFLFQKNILKNQFNHPLFRWIKFAFLTEQGNNVKEDFKEFENHKNFKEMMRVLNIEALTDDEVDMVESFQENLEDMRGYLEEEITERVTEEITERVTKNVTEKITKNITERVTKNITERVTKKVINREREKAEQKNKQRIFNLLSADFPISLIATSFDVTEEYVLQVKKEFEN